MALYNGTIKAKYTLICAHQSKTTTTTTKTPTTTTTTTTTFTTTTIHHVEAEVLPNVATQIDDLISERIVYNSLVVHRNGRADTYSIH